MSSIFIGILCYCLHEQMSKLNPQFFSVIWAHVEKVFHCLYTITPKALGRGTKS